MATQTGTLTVSDLLAVETQSVLDYGIEPIQAALERELAIHNAIMAETIGRFAELTTERADTYGHPAGGEMIEVDEFGRAPTQKTKGSTPVHYPLRAFQFAIGWTATFFKNSTPADLARQTINAETAHVRAVQRELKRAIFGATNYQFRDHLVDNYVLDVKRLANADGAVIPVGPDGETFDGATHTHYDAATFSGFTAQQKEDAILALVDDVVEHGHGGAVKIIINKADETMIRACPSFAAYVDPRIVYRNTDTPGKTLDLTRLDNRAIGLLGAAEVLVKPWGVASYVFAYDEAAPEKPLKMRQRSTTSLQGLQTVAENPAFPLVAKYMEAEFGFGVHNRTNGAVLYTGGGAYVTPTIT